MERAVGFALAIEREAAVLGALVVEEDDPGACSAGVAEWLALVDGADRPIAVRDHHAQLAVLLDDVDALDVDLRDLLLLRRLAERGKRDGAQQRGDDDRVSLEEPQLAANLVVHDQLFQRSGCGYRYRPAG